MICVYVPILTRLAWGAALVNAVRLSRLVPRYRAVRFVLGAGLALDVLRVALHLLVLQHAPRPFVGLARAAFHVDQGAVLALPALSAGLALVVLLGAPWRAVAVALSACWAALLGCVAARYPELRGDAWLDVVHRAAAASVAVQLGAAAIWRIRGWAAVRAARRRAPDPSWIAGFVPALPDRAVLVLLAGDAAALLGPWLGAPVAHWPIWQVQSALTLATLALLEERWIRARTPL